MKKVGVEEDKGVVKGRRRKWVDRIGISAATLALLVYMNTLKAGFVYDDSRAILTNPDLLPETPWSELLKNDYWGTRLTHSGSHKSFRPLTVLTFRLNFLSSTLTPWPYHALNILLHGLTTWLFVRVARALYGLGKRSRSSRSTSIGVTGASLLFAVHPIHTEAVAGVVGRADLLSTALALASFLSYASHVKLRNSSSRISSDTSREASPIESKGKLVPQRSKKPILRPSPDQEKSKEERKTMMTLEGLKSYTHLAISIALGGASMLAKEQGITILLICGSYDLLYCCLRCKRKRKNVQDNREKSFLIQNAFLECGASLTVLLAGLLILLKLRVMAMGGLDLPYFAKADNPTAHESSFFTRTATFLFLPCYNLWLLLFPHKLSFDWSMEAIPRIGNPSDPRNGVTLLVYGTLLTFVYLSIRRIFRSPENTLKNTPNIAGKHKKWHGRSCNVCSRGIYDLGRSGSNNNNSDDSNSGSKASNSKGKSRRGGNYSRPFSPIKFDSFHSSSLTFESFLLLVELTFLIIPFLPATNLFFYVGFVVAERVLYMPSVGYCLLVGHGLLHLWKRYRNSRGLILATGSSLLLLLSARTLLRSEDWVDEEKLYRSGIDINPAKSWGNLASILSSQGRSEEAEAAYRKALSFRNNMADVYYNLGLLLEGQGRLSEALVYYRSAIHFRPRLAAAYVNMGQTLVALNRIDEAIEYYKDGYRLPNDGVKDLRAHLDSKVTALLKLGKLLVERENNPRGALAYYRQAVQMMTPAYSQLQYLYNAMGEALFKIGEESKAEQWFKAALKTNPLHVPSHLTYGRMLASNKTRLLEAESWFRRAKKIAPTDYTVYYQYGQFLAVQGRVREAADSLQTAADFAPNDYEIVTAAANALQTAGEYRRAVFYAKRAEQIKPSTTINKQHGGNQGHVSNPKERVLPPPSKEHKIATGSQCSRK